MGYQTYFSWRPLDLLEINIKQTRVVDKFMTDVSIASLNIMSMLYYRQATKAATGADSCESCRALHKAFFSRQKCG